MPDPRSGRAALAVASVLGAGFLRPAPGTWGSLVGAALGIAAILLLPASPNLALALLAVVSTALGLGCVPAACRRLGRGDPSQVVIDEVAGVLVAMAMLPSATLRTAPLLAAVCCFAAFRCFDIAKPWPVGACERLPGALGVMADDVAAGILAGIVAMAALG